MPLSDTAVRQAKPQPSQFKLADGGGLYLLVRPNGTKSWRLDYRFLDKRKTLSIGLYPAVGLSEARSRREAAKKLLAAGADPAVQKKRDRAAAITSQQNTFA